MFAVKKIDSYRDGGTIAIKCVMSVRWKSVAWLEERQGQEIEICIDGRFGKMPEFWFGYPESDGSERIDDEVVDYIIEKVEEWKKYQDYKLDKVINYRRHLRERKIDDLLDE